MRMLGEAYCQAEAAKGRDPKTRLKKYCPVHLVENQLDLDWRPLEDLSDQLNEIQPEVWASAINGLLELNLDESKLRGMTQFEIVDAFCRDEIPANMDLIDFVGMINEASISK